MNLKQLEHLLAVAEAGSFSRAAERLHLTQSALSRSIRLLEEDLGTRLLDRMGKRTELTPLGLTVASRARRILFESAELRRSADLLTQGGQGHHQHRAGLGAGRAAADAAAGARGAAAPAAEHRGDARVAGSAPGHAAHAQAGCVGGGHPRHRAVGGPAHRTGVADARGLHLPQRPSAGGATPAAAFRRGGRVPAGVHLPAGGHRADPNRPLRHRRRSQDRRAPALRGDRQPAGDGARVGRGVPGHRGGGARGILSGS